MQTPVLDEIELNPHKPSPLLSRNLSFSFFLRFVFSFLSSDPLSPLFPLPTFFLYLPARGCCLSELMRSAAPSAFFLVSLEPLRTRIPGPPSRLSPRQGVCVCVCVVSSGVLGSARKRASSCVERRAPHLRRARQPTSFDPGGLRLCLSLSVSVSASMCM